ncbi:MAG: hypothetical protein PWR10_663 [Halanaerobiales bacterium]|nr:hypothetical protein [Halanaerobiales bacterium]
MDDINLDKLINFLEEEYSVYQQLYTLGKQKQEVLITEDLTGLEEIVSKEENYLNRARELKSSRERIAGNNSITMLLEKAGYPYRDKLIELQEKLSDVVLKIDDQNILNEKLIHNSLQFLNLNLNLVTSNNSQGTYDKRGQLRPKESGIINHKA